MLSPGSSCELARQEPCSAELISSGEDQVWPRRPRATGIKRHLGEEGSNSGQGDRQSEPAGGHLEGEAPPFRRHPEATEGSSHGSRIAFTSPPSRPTPRCTGTPWRPRLPCFPAQVLLLPSTVKNKGGSLHPRRDQGSHYSKDVSRTSSSSSIRSLLQTPPLARPRPAESECSLL